MGRSSLLGTEKAPLEAPGRDEDALGPGDSSDSASDRIGADALPAADPGESVDLTLGRDIAHAPIEQPGRDDEADRAEDISTDRVFAPDGDGTDEVLAPDAGTSRRKKSR